MIFKRNQNLLTKCEKKHDFHTIFCIFENPNPGFLKSKPEIRFFKTRPRFENTMQDSLAVSPGLRNILTGTTNYIQYRFTSARALSIILKTTCT